MVSCSEMMIHQAFILHLSHAGSFTYIVAFMKCLQMGNSAGVTVLAAVLQSGFLLVVQHCRSQEEKIKPHCFLKAVTIRGYCYLPLSSCDNLPFHPEVLSTPHHISYASEVMNCRNKGKQRKKAEIRF